MWENLTSEKSFWLLVGDSRLGGVALWARVIWIIALFGKRRNDIGWLRLAIGNWRPDRLVLVIGIGVKVCLGVVGTKALIGSRLNLGLAVIWRDHWLTR